MSNIFAAGAQRTAPNPIRVEIDDGQYVLMQELSGLDADMYQMSFTNADGKINRERLKVARSDLLAQMIVDENGDRVFVGKNAAQECGAAIRASLMTKLFEEAKRINGMEIPDEDEEEKND